MEPPKTGRKDLVIRIGGDELVIRRRYEALSIVNDILIAVWFIAGSIMFFSTALATAGTWMFLIGSVELLIRPVIRLARQFHLRRVHGAAATPGESPGDF
ncbi:YrhK family protein [Nocardiopsis mangrovi]|uniref:YrhK family protein n=1 Tax=Nocardiopsis mangrovi TaxID=1179818 RepID=A0ABV9DUM2_9ACTN